MAQRLKVFGQSTAPTAAPAALAAGKDEKDRSALEAKAKQLRAPIDAKIDEMVAAVNALKTSYSGLIKEKGAEKANDSKKTASKEPSMEDFANYFSSLAISAETATSAFEAFQLNFPLLIKALKSLEDTYAKQVLNMRGQLTLSAKLTAFETTVVPSILEVLDVGTFSTLPAAGLDQNKVFTDFIFVINHQRQVLDDVFAANKLELAKPKAEDSGAAAAKPKIPGNAAN